MTMIIKIPKIIKIIVLMDLKGGILASMFKWLILYKNEKWIKFLLVLYLNYMLSLPIKLLFLSF